jgi:hypothetical protein
VLKVRVLIVSAIDIILLCCIREICMVKFETSAPLVAEGKKKKVLIMRLIEFLPLETEEKRKKKEERGRSLLRTWTASIVSCFLKQSILDFSVVCL